MTVRTRGIPEVPVDITSKEQLRQFLSDLRETVVGLRGTTQLPSSPTNFKVTPMAFANLLQWTNGDNADGVDVLWSATPDISTATQIDVGLSNQHLDYVGADAVKRYYWIRSYDKSAPAGTISTSLVVGPIAGTTLASGTATATPTPPPAGTQLVKHPITGYNVNRHGRF